MSNPPEVVITRADRLRIPRVLDSGRVAKLRAYKGRVPEWADPSPTVYVEPIIVCISAREIERCFDHFYSDVIRFEDLISQKKLTIRVAPRIYYKVSIKDGVFAYLLIFGHGSRHLIAGFLTSKYATPLFPELDGKPSFPDFTTVTPSTCGEALSKLKAEGWMIK